ncbi:SNF2-related protein [Alicyclobacillus tolerans]|uniref:Adenine-specific DNA-methyltransferase n=1 Tax=Alicyclobacillus tolerans TaxID=90970 RepID=A0ABT9LZI3_9BACL|nr:SNF2-related protein [Alicyclobacillus tengchongensis]MDP9729679.1 adenine-specific DNA-methyltransferase [Alicyclobacillus tengchongensis]
MSTPYHSKLWAHLLTLRAAADDFDRITRAAGNARVDVNPHQIDAALFALRSPLSQGAILADEVGLGKTIEAGLVLSQRWAERRRKLIVVVPATLRKQWAMELEEKFHLPSVIMEAKSFKTLQRQGYINPFDLRNQVIICSYHFAAAKSEWISMVTWDLAVLDEAHRLRNVYKSTNKLAKNIQATLARTRKLLLTATPLQNSLMELYGLVSIVDPQVFGDEKSFQAQFTRQLSEERNRLLRERLASICTRTLRKQVLEYIKYTNRIPITQEFMPSDDEHRLYEEVTEYLRREVLLALPASQRSLMTLVLRKLLASSTFAIAGTLRGLIRRLESMQPITPEDVADDYEGVDELEDEWDGPDNEEAVDQQLLAEELSLLRKYADLAESIRDNAKGDALLIVLDEAIDKAKSLGAAEKAVIFTESRRTQQYLYQLLTQNGYEGQVVLFNGVNSDPLSTQIYNEWLKRHDGESVITGSRSADIRAALIEEFRDRAKILVATESAAEGVNLQFCSLVVNYDLPWNPQRVEQRIGRCHRYGQKHDVVVVNFLNKRNEADQRVYELLAEKFQLFSGIFGASDEVLGALESGVDLEKRIAQVYQECRTTEEINAAFDALQKELESSIESRLTETRRALLDNFDEDVYARLKVYEGQAHERLSEQQQYLLSLAKVELADSAIFDETLPRFRYSGGDAPPGMYHLDWKLAEANGDTFFRVDHPLAQSLVERAVARELPTAEIVVQYSDYEGLISTVQELKGKSGWLSVAELTVESFELEEFLIFAGVTDAGEIVDEETCLKLFKPYADVRPLGSFNAPLPKVTQVKEQLVKEKLHFVEEKNARYFDEEVAKLDRWADDLKFGLEQEIRDLDKQIRELRRTSTTAISLADKLAAQKAQRDIEAQRNRKRRELYEAQDAIDAKRNELIENIERQLKQTHRLKPLFTIRWTVV